MKKNMLIGFIVGSFSVIFTILILSCFHKINVSKIIKDRKAISLVSGDVLKVSSGKGVAIIEFIYYGTNSEDSSRFRWQYRTRVGDETTGNGLVFEKYEKKEIAPNRYLMIDRGGRTKININEIKLEWSYASSEQCWLYYNASNLSVEIMTNKEPRTPINSIGDVNLWK